MKKQSMDKWLLLLMYGLAFLLIREWLEPIADLTETGHIAFFYGFVAFSLLLGLFQIPMWIGIIVKTAYIYLAVQYIFYGSRFLSIEAMQTTVTEFNRSIALIWAGDWMESTYIFRTILFFVLLWMITYLLRFWLEYKKSIFVFLAMTILFLAFLDTFTEVDASSSILRVMLIGLFLLGLLFPIRLASKAQIPLPFLRTLKTALPLGVVLLSAAFIAVILPAKAPAWPDPMPYIRSAAGIGDEGDKKGTGVSKVGYDPDDTQLGGPFRQDDTLVFEAYVDKRQYWKMETKNTYTSKGWTQEDNGEPEIFKTDFVQTIQEGEPVPPLKRADIQLSEPLPILPYPYGFLELQTTVPGLVYGQGQKTETLTIHTDEPLDLKYRTEFAEPEYSLKALRATTIEDLEPSLPEMEEYLQLSDETPGRVKELAEELTAEASSVYEKAQEIERYFGRGGFVYARDNIATPSEGEDYVDQFVFETKRGYCDNFSSSMVVMLRSVGIPARWVKGFAPGEQRTDANQENYYEVTNNQAHSWVEAYMPGAGWMPFEPTIGFTGATNVNYDIETSEEETPEEEVKRPEDQEKEDRQKQTAKKKKNDTSWTTKLIPAQLRSRGILAGIAVVLAAVLLVSSWVTRKKWLPSLIIRMDRHKDSGWAAFTWQYEQLLKQLRRIGIEKPPNITLAAYAKQVDRLRGDDKMSTFTAVYEKGLYGQQEMTEEWDELREIWKDLIIETSG